MKLQEANKAICGYMGTMCFESSKHCINSLDALIPVWKKLKATGFVCNERFARKRYSFTICLSCGYGDTIQEAATIATAKAIQELSNE